MQGSTWSSALRAVSRSRLDASARLLSCQTSSHKESHWASTPNLPPYLGGCAASYTRRFFSLRPISVPTVPRLLQASLDPTAYTDDRRWSGYLFFSVSGSSVQDASFSEITTQSNLARRPKSRRESNPQPLPRIEVAPAYSLVGLTGWPTLHRTDERQPSTGPAFWW
jgi:hypothetical protein